MLYKYLEQKCLHRAGRKTKIDTKDVTQSNASRRRVQCAMRLCLNYLNYLLCFTKPRGRSIVHPLAVAHTHLALVAG